MSTEFADLYHAHYRRIVVQVHAYLGDLAEAQDLTQEAFCRALDRWSRVSGYEDPSAWVRRVALNLATSRHRRQRTVTRFLARQREEHVDGPGPDRVALTRALAALPPKHRLAVVQHHLGRLSAAEIARDEGVAEGTVRSWLSRGRTQLAAQFSEFEPVSVAAQRPAGPQAAHEVVRKRRRTRTATLAAIVVAAVALPLLLIALNRAQQPPIVDHTPTPSPTADTIAAFTIVVPGVDLPVKRVKFVEANVGWAWLSSCNSAPCPSALASTTDGGRTWRRAALPELTGSFVSEFQPLSASTAVLAISTEDQNGAPQLTSFLQTTDGGATFQSVSPQAPSLEVRLAAPEGGIGRYRLLCPGSIGWNSGVDGCAQQDLYRIGAGVVTPRPPLLGRSDVGGGGITEGADGRLWLTYVQTMQRNAYSVDEGLTWTEVGQHTGSLTVSPDGKDVWISNGSRPVRLVGDAWVTPGYIPQGSFVNGFLAVGDGTIVVVRENVVTFIGPQGLTEVKSFAAPGLGALPDGTVLAFDDNTIYLGKGTGVSREWTAVRW